jgi:MFS family permease
VCEVFLTLWLRSLNFDLAASPDALRARYYVRKGNLEKAAHVLTRLRGEPEGSVFIQNELAEIVANNEYEISVIPQGGYFVTWMNCFSGGLRRPSSNLRRTILGTSLQMMQQWTGINFIFYFGTTFFKELGTIKNPFLMGLITTLVNVCSTPISFWIVERFGRRPIMIWGALGMLICEFIVGIVGVTAAAEEKHNHSAVSAQIALICIYIFFFATTW